MTKNPHAVALGRIKTAKKAAASRRNGAGGGGRPPFYRLTGGRLEQRKGTTWTRVDPPYNLAERRAIKRHSPR